MATGPTAVTSVALTNTFDEWRNSTNDLITIINAANSANPEGAVVFANSEQSFSANAIVANSIQANVTSSLITATGANLNFTSANVTSLGNVHQTHILGGTVITGSTPDSSISNVQLNYAEINLNGANFNANGSSTINLNGATISDLGTVSTVDLNSGTIDGCDITITGASGSLTITGGTQDFSGATISSPTIAGGTIRTLQVHSSNLTVNGTSTLVTNTGTIFGSNNNDAANVGIGTFPEYTEAGATRTPTSSHGKLHVRQGFATGTSSGTQPTANAQSNALVLENETSTGLSIITANDANGAITFGDEDDSDIGQLLYHHANNDLTIRTNAQDKLRVHTASGGSLQIPGANTFGTIGGKLHVNVGSSDATSGIYLDSNDADQVGISVDGEQTTAHVMRMDVDALTTGSAIFVDDNSASTGARKIVNIVQDHVDATGGKALFVKTDGMDAVEINQNAAAKVGLNVYSSTAHSTQLVLLVDDGAATAETLYVRNDATTTTTKVVTVANSSADMFTIAANGNIGIAHNSPSFELDITGEMRATTNMYIGRYLYHDGDVDTYIDFEPDQIDFVTGGDRQLLMDGSTTYLYHDGNEKLRTLSHGIDVSGNLIADRVYPCFGESTSIYLDYPTGSHGSIQINGSGASNYEGYSIDGRAVFMHDGASSMGLWDDVNNHWALLHVMNGATSLYYDGNAKLATYSSGVDVTGNVLADRVYPCYDASTGIYFDYPTGDYGSIQINGSGAGNYEGYSIDGRAVFMHDGSTTVGLYDDVNNHWILHHSMNGATALYYDGVSKFATTSAGVQVNGTATVTSSLTATSGTTTFGTDVRIGQYLYHSGDTNTYIAFGADTIDFYTGGDRQLYMNAAETYLYFNGSYKLYTTGSGVTVVGTMTETSALALKENIEPITNSLSIIDGLQGVKYDWKDKEKFEDRRQIGLIAENVKEVIPEAEVDGTVSYTKLVGLLVEGIKDLNKEVTDLKAKING